MDDMDSAKDKSNKKPQMNADERRLENFNAQQPSGFFSGAELNKSPQRTRRTQSIATILFENFALYYKKVPPQRRRTRMTRIGRIFTDTFNPCVSVSSVQSVFHPIKIKIELIP